jgi:hypothetical protein
VLTIVLSTQRGLCVAPNAALVLVCEFAALGMRFKSLTRIAYIVYIDVLRDSCGT